MEFIDLSREIFHRTQTHPNHPPMIMTVWNDHSDKRVAGNTVFSSKALSIAFSDHCGTHVDAPVLTHGPVRRRSTKSRWRTFIPKPSASICHTCR